MKWTGQSWMQQNWTELTLNWEREWGEDETCSKHKYPSYPVWSHLPANYTAYYPWALYRSPKSDWIMGAQPLPVTEQHCQVVWQPERTSSYSFHPPSLSVSFSSSLFLTLCASASLPVNLTSLQTGSLPWFSLSLISIFYFSDFSHFSWSNFDWNYCTHRLSLFCLSHVP